MSALSFADDILPLLRPGDIGEMEAYGMDLSSYEDVKKRANDIYKRLAAKDMPCDKPWGTADIAKFKRWIESGMQP